MSTIIKKMNLKTEQPIDEMEVRVQRGGKPSPSSRQTSFSVLPEIEVLQIIDVTNYTPGIISFDNEEGDE